MSTLVLNNPYFLDSFYNLISVGGEFTFNGFESSSLDMAKLFMASPGERLIDVSSVYDQCDEVVIGLAASQYGEKCFSESLSTIDGTTKNCEAIIDFYTPGGDNTNNDKEMLQGCLNAGGLPMKMLVWKE